MPYRPTLKACRVQRSPSLADITIGNETSNRSFDRNLPDPYPSEITTVASRYVAPSLDGLQTPSRIAARHPEVTPPPDGFPVTPAS